MANIGYALDILGTNPLNKVTETRTLNKKALDGRAFVIPKATPFFTDSVKIYKNGIPLIAGHDYHPILNSPELSHLVEKDIRAGFIFNTVSVSDTVTFEIQTIGGDFNVPIGNTIENMVRVIRNPIFTTWSQLVGTPQGLAPNDHIHEWGSTVGWEEFLGNFDKLYIALINGSGGSGGGGDGLLQHLLSPNAHNKAAVGLGLVGNFALAQDADFNTKPYPNNKYTTPRSVMYAIDRFIGTTLTDQQLLIDNLKTTLTQNTLAYNNLVQQWEDLKVNLASVQDNYASMVLAVNGYASTLSRFESEYKAINDNQKVWLEKLQEFNTTLTDYSRDYNQIIAVKDDLINNFNNLKASFDILITKYDQLSAGLTATVSRVANIEDHAVYPTIKTIPAGSFHFKVRPDEKFAITLIGAGGGHAEFITTDATLVPFYKGENGTSTTLWCLQNTATGENSPSSAPIALAGGGFGAEGSYGTAANNITKYGLGGRGGEFKVMAGITIDEASNGEGGIKGYGEYKPNVISIQDTGYDHFGSKWGKGSNCEDALGQGGEGAIVRLQLTNTTNKELEYMIQVGVAGRSHNSDKSNATGGLAIINKIN